MHYYSNEALYTSNESESMKRLLIAFVFKYNLYNIFSYFFMLRNGTTEVYGGK